MIQYKQDLARLGGESLIIMKRILFLIITFIMFFMTLAVQAEPSKVMSLNFDDTSNLVYINMLESAQNSERQLKYAKLENPNRI